MNEGVKKTLFKVIQEYGLYKAINIVGLDICSLINHSGYVISNADDAYMVVSELLEKKQLPKKYKGFEIYISQFDGVVHWYKKIPLKNNNGEIEVSVLATPFWDGETVIPIELSRVELINGDNSEIIYELGDGTEMFKNVSISPVFKDCQSVHEWYSSEYLPLVYEKTMGMLQTIIRDYYERQN